jgi:hypothetical protein
MITPAATTRNDAATDTISSSRRRSTLSLSFSAVVKVAYSRHPYSVVSNGRPTVKAPPAVGCP